MFKQRLTDQLNPKHPLYRLAERIPWEVFEKVFESLYSHAGRQAHPIRRMVGLLILKQLRDLSGESVVERWIDNGYYQYFCGEVFFQWELPCHPTDIVYFRKRNGKKGIEKILEISIEFLRQKAQEREVFIDTTVQEKNITFPTDTKLYRKICEKCASIAEKEQVKLKQKYRWTVKKLMLAQRFRNHPENFKKTREAEKKLKTIAGRLIRDIERKLSYVKEQEYSDFLSLFKKVLSQTISGKNKVYSLHEPQVSFIGKGKEHKKYEFGAKGSSAVIKDSGIVVGAVSHPQNIHDNHTLIDVISQVAELRNQCPEVAICDGGYRGRSKIGETKIIIPKPPGKRQTSCQKQKARSLSDLSKFRDVTA